MLLISANWKAAVIVFLPFHQGGFDQPARKLT
jgi:hypothetical protein